MRGPHQELLDLILKAARLGRVAGQDGFLKRTWPDLAFLVRIVTEMGKGTRTSLLTNEPRQCGSAICTPKTSGRGRAPPPMRLLVPTC